MHGNKIDTHDLKLLIINNPGVSVWRYAEIYGCSILVVRESMAELNIKRSERPFWGIG